MRSLMMAVAMVTALPAMATQLAVTRYDMVNGGGQSTGGSSNYWDLAYTGSGCTNCDYAALSGGVGDLTDGVVANDIWYPLESGAGTGPYVGWWDFHAASPVVTFHLAGNPVVDSIAIHMDNSNFGGVLAPTTIRIDGQAFGFAAPTLGTTGWVNFAGLTLSGPVHTIQFVQAPNTYTFISEVSFFGTPAPEPAQWAMLGMGFALLGSLMRRRARVTAQSSA